MIDDTKAYTDQVMLSMIARETAYHATTDEQRHQEGLLERIQSAQIDRGQSGRRCCTYGEEQAVDIFDVIDSIGRVEDRRND